MSEANCNQPTCSGFYMAMIADGGYLRFRTPNGEWTPIEMIYQCRPKKKKPKKPAFDGAFWVYFPNKLKV